MTINWKKVGIIAGAIVGAAVMTALFPKVAIPTICGAIVGFIGGWLWNEKQNEE